MTTKVQAEFLAAGIISDQTQVSAADADHVLIFDASDNSLKKALVSTITSSGAVAADDITAGDGAVTISTTSGDITIDNGSSDDDIIFKGTDGGSDITALRLDMSAEGGATFNGNITLGDNKGVYFGAGSDLIISSDGTNGAVAAANGGLTLDVVGDITFDADGGDILFKDDGLLTATLSRNVANFEIMVNQSDGDFVVKVNDGGSTITPFRLDMSTGGRALFYSDLVALETAGQYIQMAGSSSNYWAIGSTGGSNPPGTASTTLAFHHYNGSAWNNEVEFDSSGNITLDGNIVFSNNSKVRQDSAGLIVETLDSDEDIFFSGNDGGSAITAVRIDMSDAGAIICNGNVTAFGSTSDIRLKENIEIISNPLDKVKELKGVTFNYKKDGQKSTGLIAQDLEKVLPEAVYESSDINDDEEKHLAIRYGNTVGLLVEAIKELEARVKELEGK